MAPVHGLTVYIRVLYRPALVGRIAAFLSTLLHVAES